MSGLTASSTWVSCAFTRRELYDSASALNSQLLTSSMTGKPSNSRHLSVPCGVAGSYSAARTKTSCSAACVRAREAAYSSDPAWCRGRKSCTACRMRSRRLIAPRRWFPPASDCAERTRLHPASPARSHPPHRTFVPPRDSRDTSFRKDVPAASARAHCAVPR